MMYSQYGLTGMLSMPTLGGIRPPTEGTPVTVT